MKYIMVHNKMYIETEQFFIIHLLLQFRQFGLFIGYKLINSLIFNIILPSLFFLRSLVI